MVILVGDDLYRKEIILYGGKEKIEISSTTFGGKPIITIATFHKCSKECGWGGWRQDEEFILPKEKRNEILEALKNAIKVSDCGNDR